MDSPDLDKLATAIEKVTEDGAVTYLDQMSTVGVDNWIPTGSYSLDAILGGGIPCGRLSVLVGGTFTGKTTLLYHLLASAQQINGLCLIEETEHTLSPQRAGLAGIEFDKMMVYQPGCVEEMFDTMEAALDEYLKQFPDGRPGVIGWDSVSATCSKGEMEAEDSSDSGGIGEHARAVSKGLRRIMRKIRAAEVAFVITAQEKSKINLFGSGGYSYLAGKPIGFHSSVEIRLRKRKTLPGGKGTRVKAETKKNKVFAPFKTCYFDILTDRSMDDGKIFVESAVKAKIISIKGGGWYVYKKEEDSEGETFRASEFESFLESHPNVKAQVMEAVGLSSGDDSNDD